MKTILLLWICPAIFAGEIADAAMNRDAGAVRALLARKADVNAPQADGATALHWAAKWDDLTMVRALLEAGANPQAANRHGATPLFLATMNGAAATIALLLAKGADPNAPILAHGETALMMASRTGNLAAMQALLDAGARVNAAESLRGTTALMWAAEQGHAAAIELLARRGADLKATSAVLHPVKRRALGFAPPDAPLGTKGGLPALAFAVRQGSMEAVKALAAAGADINQPSVDESTPVLVAVQNGFYAIAQFLIERGADPGRANNKGWTPLYLAVKNRNQEVTADPGPSTEGVLDFIRLLVDRKVDLNVRIRTETEVHQGMSSLWLREPGATPLLRAAMCGDLEVVRLLLDRGADPHIPTFDNTTALMAASGVGWADGMIREHTEEQTLEVIKLLIERGANVNAANDHGITPLHGAGYKGANQAVQLLVDRGADLAAEDKGEDFGFGASSVRMTPLNWAEGVPIGMSSAIFHADTVALMTKLMRERGIPAVSHRFTGQKPADYQPFGGAAGQAGR